MRLFLIRHGESVDNVAGLYAGSRDSPLTNHGVLQARRLGTHLASRREAIGPVRYIFSSNLQRAVKTAQAVLDAQPKQVHGFPPGDGPAAIVQLAELREKDFRSSEGKRFGARADATLGGGQHNDAESYDEMKIRTERFIDEHLMKLLVDAGDDQFDREYSLVVVAHGIILNVLLKCLMARFSPKELGRTSTRGDPAPRVEYLASWSNTGYLEMLARTPGTPGTPRSNASSKDLRSQGSSMIRASDKDPAESNVLTKHATELSVVAMNCVAHLQGLKKTRGGIGSAKFDEKQKTMDSFFTRPGTKRKNTTDDGT